MSLDQFDILGKTAQDAEKSSVRTNFGKMSVEVLKYIHWVDGYPVDVDAETYSTLRKDNSIKMVFGIDVTEFNPALDFEVKRQVDIPGKDWHQIVKKSIVSVLGKKVAENYGEAFRKLNGAYVEVNDVPQVKGGEYSTIQLVKVFKDRTECFNAYVERFGDPAERTTTNAPVQTSIDCPTGYDAESWESVKPFVKEALDSGQPPIDVATDYKVARSEIKFIMQVKNA